VQQGHGGVALVTSSVERGGAVKGVEEEEESDEERSRHGEAEEKEEPGGCDDAYAGITCSP
jgi:hypothetical protein